MKKRLKDFYPSVYYCSSNGGMIDETEKFLQDLYRAIGKDKNYIDLDEIPF